MRRREGRYLLRANLCAKEPAELRQLYIQLTEIEAAFKNLKDELKLRPIYHRRENRIEAHIFIAFLSYCLHVTLQARLEPSAGALTPLRYWTSSLPSKCSMFSFHHQAATNHRQQKAAPSAPPL